MSIRIALIGNPNCGKTTMFNALTGSNQYVGNWPGVTVEKKEGHWKKDKEVVITDLPGIYSLSPYTLEEVVSRDYLLKEKPEAVINLVDATNIERNLYLTTQVLEAGIPVVIALNMMDIIRKRGDVIDTKKLAKELGCEVVETSALQEKGIHEAVEKAAALAKSRASVDLSKKFSSEVEKYISEIDDILPENISSAEQRRWYVVKVFEQDEKVLEELKLSQKIDSEIKAIVKKAETENDDTTESVITNERYEFIVGVVSDSVKKPKEKMTTSDKIDQIVTNRILGLPIFALVMVFVYWLSVCSGGFGTNLCDWVNDVLFGDIIPPAVEGFLTNAGVNDVLIDVIVNGIIGGVGSVLGFLPQMIVLFFCLSILEDIGYMVRIAFVMDRVFRHFGLSGKSFIPLLIGAGCGVPGIMASKTIENDNDRRLTIMTATYIPCGAKLPVIALLAGVIFGGPWYLAPLMYFIGIAAVLVVAIVLKKTKPFHGQAAPFVMELPAYHIPSPKTVLLHVWERTWAFLKKAGTILFLACLVMWFLSSYGFENGAFCLVSSQEFSLMASVGKALAWIFIPVGFGSWQAVASSISGFVAKESIVTTMSILSLGAEAAEDDPSLWAGVQTFFPQATMAVSAFSFLIFNLINSPCLAAISTMAKELNDKKWTAFAIIFQNVFAYFVAFLIYQIGSFIVYGIFTVATVIAFIGLAVLLFLIFRPDPYRHANLEARRSVA